MAIYTQGSKVGEGREVQSTNSSDLYLRCYRMASPLCVLGIIHVTTHLAAGRSSTPPSGIWKFQRQQDLQDPNLQKSPSGGFRELRYLILGVFITRILLFRVLYEGPLFSEPPISRFRSKVSETRAKAKHFQQGLCHDYDSEP